MTAGTHLRENVDKGSVEITGLTILGRAPNVQVILQICQFIVGTFDIFAKFPEQYKH